MGFDGPVYATGYVGSAVYVGGSFQNAIVDGRSVPRKRLAALDARTGKLLSWAPETSGTVMALTSSGPVGPVQVRLPRRSGGGGTWRVCATAGTMDR